MAKIFQREWQKYREILPAGASPVQIIETRRAFYGGGTALLSLMMKNLEEGEEPTEADLIMMDQVHEEFTQFRADVAAGKA